MTAKTTLRKQIKQTLKRVSQASIEAQSLRVTATLRASAVYRSATNVMVYMNMPESEVRTMPLIRECFRDGKNVYLPRCVPLEPSQPKRFPAQKAYMKMVHMPDVASVERLTPQGPYGLLEPLTGRDIFDQHREPEGRGAEALNAAPTVDLVVLPGVAFTTRLQRMGHGAGFYDDFIKRYGESTRGKNRRLRLVAVGLAEQLVEALPVEAHDEVLDGLVIDGAWYP